MTEHKKEHTVLLAILIAFSVLGAVYSINTPIFEASDELWHYPMVQHIANHWTLPVQPLEPGTSSGPWRQEASQQPLYYGLGAALTFWIDTTDMDEVRHLNPHVAAGEITADGNNPNLIVHNPELETFPWRGTVLAIHIVRFFSVLLGTWAVYLTWALVRELFPARPWLALTSAAVHAFTPMYIFISASVNNDNLVVPLCTWALLKMVRLIKNAARTPGAGQDKLSIRAHLSLGIVLGLGLLTKASAIGLLPLVAATLFWESWKLYKTQLPTQSSNASDESPSTLLNRVHWPILWQSVGVFTRNLGHILAPSLLISGWWYYRNFRLYGDWLGLNAFYAVLGTRDISADFAQLWSERFAFATGYWGNFGGLNVPMPDWAYAVLNGIAVLAIFGILVRFIRWLLTPHPQEPAPKQTTQRTPQRRIHTLAQNLWPFFWDDLTAARALSWAWPAAVFVSWTRWATITWSSQGRLIFSAIPMWSLALVLGLTIWVPRKAVAYRRTLAMNFSAFLLGLCLVAPMAWIAPAYVIPERGYPTQIANPMDIRFGNALNLRGYALQTDEIRPGDAVALTLYWESLTPTATDHSLFLHLLGHGDRIVAQRDTFPGRGLLSTTWIEPGYRWTEHMIIHTPPMAYAPDTLSLALGMVDTTTGVRLPADSASGESLGESARFGNIALTPKSGDAPNPITLHFGKGMLLRGYDLSNVVTERGDLLTVTLFWQCEAVIDADYTISVQLIDPQWRKAGQSDAWPLDGAAPTSSWQPGQQLVEERQINIAADAAPGSYDLTLAIYRQNDDGALEHLPIVWEKGQMPAKSVTLTRVRVR